MYFDSSLLGDLILCCFSSTPPPQVKRNHQSRTAQRPRPPRPLTAMGALTLWTLRLHLASAATAPRCQAPTTPSSLKSSNSRRRSSSRASTCMFHHTPSHTVKSLILSRLYCGYITFGFLYLTQLQQETKERNPVPSRARHAGYNPRRPCSVPAPGRET